MNQPTYLFYDLETTGLNPCFDQVMQFAAIRTDSTLNEIERCEFFIKLNPDVRPSPYALITHQIGIDEIENSEPEITAIRRIHQMINQPGTISVGYNTLGFDDEFLRFSFYRNLLPPYTHQYANQCGRMDIYPITVLYYLYANSTLNWPSRNNHVSMKLEDLNTANQLAEGQAHNALIDVEATLALARILASNDTLWNYVTGYFNKNTDLQRLNTLPSGINIALEPKLGSKHHFQCLVTHIGQHQHYKNQSLWLRLDQIDFSETAANELETKSFCLKKRGGEAPIILPPKERYLKQTDEDKIALANKNLAWLNQHNNQTVALIEHHQHYQYPLVDPVDVDAALYQSDFASRHDQKLFEQFHQKEPHHKKKIINQFNNKNYQEIAQRLIARHYPEQLSTTEAEHFSQYLTQARIDYRNKKQPSWQLCLEEISEIRKETDLNDKQEKVLFHYEQYIKEHHLKS